MSACEVDIAEPATALLGEADRLVRNVDARDLRHMGGERPDNPAAPAWAVSFRTQAESNTSRSAAAAGLSSSRQIASFGGVLDLSPRLQFFCAFCSVPDR
jgi:hypothetical protein